MDFIMYILFSTIEAVSVHVVMLCLFRFGIRDYIVKILISSILFAIFTYAIRVELNLENYSPAISVIAFWFIAYAIIRTPPFWSLVMSMISTTVFFALQTALLLILQFFSLVSLERVQSYQSDGQLLQVVTAFVAISSSLYLYRRGFGFSFGFDKFRLKKENVLMLTIVCVTFIILFIIFILKSIFYGAIIGGLLLCYMLYLAIKKERSDP